MAEASKRHEIPADFGSIEEAAEFWDAHDLADFGDRSREVEAEISLRRRTYLTALEPTLARRLLAEAEKQGVSTETLINVWLSERLSATIAE